MKWKPEWPETRRRFTDWWAGRGLLVAIPAPRSRPRAELPEPEKPAGLERQWLDPEYRLRRGEFVLANTHFGGDAFPSFNALIGPGSLCGFLGARPVLEPDTVWYRPRIEDPGSDPPIRFDPENNEWLDRHLAVIEAARADSRGRYAIGIPDLFENLDVLAALRGSQRLLVDLFDRPDWVEESVRKINRAFQAAFDLFFERVRDGQNGNVFTAFSLWGPGRTAKVQCDFSCMISGPMFERFVVPSLAEQCAGLDYSMYHLDGSGALRHLDSLLAIEPLNAIEWTPEPGLPGGGNPRWHDLYGRIKAGGKAVQAIGVRPEEVVPLLDAVGPEGMYIVTRAGSEAEAEALAARVEPYR